MTETQYLMLQLPPQTQVDTIHNLTLHIVWASDCQQLKDALVTFWLENQAIPSRAEALDRTRQVVCVALDQHQQLAGVSTAYIAPFGESLAPYYFFRTFIKADARRLGLALRFVAFTHAHLANVSTDMTPKPKGMVIVTDNLRLKLGRINKWLNAQGFVLLGLTTEQKEVWKVDF